MTCALTLTAAEWEVLQRDGTAWIAWDAINDPCDHIRYACEAPCRRCLGHRWVPGNRDGLDYGYHPHERQPCPDCRITLVGECPTCRGAKCAYPCATRPEPLECVEYECYCTCQGSGTVTLGYAYADSVAVWGDHSVGCSSPATIGSTLSWRKPAWQVWPAVTADLAHFGDLRALVGRYALKVRLA